MTVFTSAGFQYYGAALEGTPRRPPALGISASCTPAQSTAVSHRRGRISSGSPENRGEYLCASWGNWRRPTAPVLSASFTPSESTAELSRRGRVNPASNLNGQAGLPTEVHERHPPPP